MPEAAPAEGKQETLEAMKQPLYREWAQQDAHEPAWDDPTMCNWLGEW